MKMKIGDYVRTKRGEIGKIIDFINEPTDYYFNCYETTLKDFTNKYITEDSDIKSSSNIIDLIEEGDILKVNDFKDVYTIYEVEMFRNPYTNEKYLGIRNDIGRKPKRLGEIPLVNLSIITKEQFESMEYKL